MRVSTFLAVFSGVLLPGGAAPLASAQEITAPPAVAEKAPGNGERGASRRAQNEMRLRATMQEFGIEEAISQDALIAYLAEDEAGKSAVRGAARRLMVAVRTQAAPQRTRDLIAIYKAAIDADRERRRAAQAALDAKVGFSLSPRLEATLWLLGVLGEGQTSFTPNPLSLRPPRNAGGEGGRDGRENGRDGGRDGNREGGRQRGGVVVGNIIQKGDGWLEVQAEKGGPDRYLFPESTGETPVYGPDINKTEANKMDANADETARSRRAVLELLLRVSVGQRVRLQWMWSDGRRIVRLEAIAAAPPAPQNAPGAEKPAPNPDGAAPAPAPAAPPEPQNAPDGAP